MEDGYDGIISELSIEGIVDGIEKLYRDVELRNELSTNCVSTNYSNSYELEKLYSLNA
ncbi:hypothetical protein D3C87_2203590 [compost metagenome]